MWVWPSVESLSGEDFHCLAARLPRHGLGPEAVELSLKYLHQRRTGEPENPQPWLVSAGWELTFLLPG